MLNATQLVGLVATAVVVVACLVARRRRPWRILAALHAALFIDLLGNFRHHLHDLVDAGLIADGLYQQRSGPQIVLLGLIAVSALALVVMLFKLKRTTERIGILSSGALVLLFLVEIISLHRVDAMLYRPVGPIMTIALLWAGLCLVTACAAMLDKPAPRRGKRKQTSGNFRQQRR
jgi:hypothetical protein